MHADEKTGLPRSFLIIDPEDGARFVVMDIAQFVDLATQCAPDVHPQTLAVIASTESSFNPYAIAIVSGKRRWRLQRQPKNRAEAEATVRELVRSGFDFSLGIMQVYRPNLGKYRLTLTSAFDACENIRAGAAIYAECVERARRKIEQERREGRLQASTMTDEQRSYRYGLSCYYSGDFSTGYREKYVSQAIGQAVKLVQGTPVSAPATIDTAATQSNSTRILK